MQLDILPHVHTLTRKSPRAIQISLVVYNLEDFHNITAQPFSGLRTPRAADNTPSVSHFNMRPRDGSFRGGG